MCSLLKEVRDSEIGVLLDQLRPELPTLSPTFGFLNTIRVYGRRKLADPKIYIPKSDDAPFFIVVSGVFALEGQCLHVHWNKKTISDERLADLLFDLPCFNASDLILFYGTQYDLLDQIGRVMQNDSRNTRKLTRKPIVSDIICSLSPMNLPELRIPKDFVVKRLEEDDAELTYNNWNFKMTDTLQAEKTHLSMYPCYGIYEKGRKDPVAWALSKNTGEIGNTYTNPLYRRKGLASIATIKVAKSLIQDGLNPHVLIPPRNYHSLKLHERLGFQPQSLVGCDVYRKDELHQSLSHKL